ncbi:MAG: D-2-hydroxyacid dehydrogenase [Nitrococcus sp.]|nr:D-2-hydroxyacid dehydrogenase [Nitrococcus sp.]
MTQRVPDKPVITVLAAPGEALPPGLDSLAEMAALRQAWDAESLRATLPGAHVLCVTDFRTGALRQAWPCADRLQWIHATSAGVDAVLIAEVRTSDVLLTNARGIFDRPIAEYVLGQIIAFAKDFHRNWELQQRQEWVHRDTERVQGKRALVVGAGAIGREIARLARAVGLTVEGIARSERSADPDFEAVYAAHDLCARLPDADFVIVAAPLTQTTRGLFDAVALRCMKRTARLINIGRGPIVVTDALVQALQEGWIAGAALDVFEEEPLPENHPLWRAPNTVVSAHMAGDFLGWREALIEQFIEQFRRWRRGEPLHNLVDKGRGYVGATKE